MWGAVEQWVEHAAPGQEESTMSTYVVASVHVDMSTGNWADESGGRRA